MLRKPSEGNRKIDGFKKFTELKGGKAKSSKEADEFEAEMEEQPLDGSELPGNPNLPEETSYTQGKKPSTKSPKSMSTKPIQPEEFEGEDDDDDDDEELNEDTKVRMIGKVAKFPKKVKASKAYNFLENVKISKNSIWYIMVEKQDNELQMVKYNYKKGVDLVKFVNELKGFYISKYGKMNKDLPKILEKIEVDGTDKYSTIKNIPLIELGGRKLIGIITEDLIKLLSK
jgi:hypothetical protein